MKNQFYEAKDKFSKFSRKLLPVLREMDEVKAKRVFKRFKSMFRREIRAERALIILLGDIDIRALSYDIDNGWSRLLSLLKW